MVMSPVISIDIGMDYGYYPWLNVDSHRGVERNSRK